MSTLAGSTPGPKTVETDVSSKLIKPWYMSPNSFCTEIIRLEPTKILLLVTENVCLIAASISYYLNFTWAFFQWKLLCNEIYTSWTFLVVKNVSLLVYAMCGRFACFRENNKLKYRTFWVSNDKSKQIAIVLDQVLTEHTSCLFQTA